MNPIVQDFLLSLARKALTIAATWLVAGGWIAASDTEKYVGGFALLLVSVVWSLWKRVVDRRQLLTAMDMPGGTSEATVRAMAKLAPPSVL